MLCKSYIFTLIVILGSTGGPNACGRCDRAVYPAEKIVAAGKVN